MVSRALRRSSALRGPTKKGWVQPLPDSVGTVHFQPEGSLERSRSSLWSSCSRSYQRANMRAVLRKAGWVVTSFTRSPMK